jgi:hypothetical protein
MIMSDILSTQISQIEQHLRSGKSITALQALKLYGCLRLGARIYDLKDKGLDIEKVMVKKGVKSFAKYTLKIKN